MYATSLSLSFSFFSFLPGFNFTLPSLHASVCVCLSVWRASLTTLRRSLLLLHFQYINLQCASAWPPPSFGSLLLLFPLLPLFILLSHYCSSRARCLLDGSMKKDPPSTRPVPSRATMMGPQRLTASLWWWYWVISAIKYESCIWYFSPLRSSASSRLGSIHPWLHPVRIATTRCCFKKKIDIFIIYLFWFLTHNSLDEMYIHFKCLEKNCA